MNPRHLTSGRLLVATLALALLPGCGHKRPPAVATSARDASPPSSDASDSRPPTDRIDAGRDVRAVGNEGLGEEFLASNASGEGGPLADILFEYDQSALTDTARGILEKHAVWIKAHPAARINVEGHCDERGTAEYNLALGTKRAEIVRDYLVSLGVATDKLRPVSLGKERPLDQGHNEAAWTKNRRAHFAVSR